MKVNAALLLSLLTPTVIQARTATVTFKTETDEYKLTFDPEVISEDHVRRLALLSPYTGGEGFLGPFWAARSNDGGVLDKIFMAPLIEWCVSGDPDYVECGEPDFRSVNFYRNAQVNLNKGRKQLALLSSIKYPKELRPVVMYLKESLSFSLWSQQTRFDYYKSWHTNVLRRKYKGFDLSLACPEILEEIQKAGSKEDKYKLARHQWHNCVLHSFQSRFGIYPIQAWKHFLTAYGIKEETRYIGPD